MEEEPGAVAVAAPGRGSFAVHLDVFEGPFDLLLNLIAKHKLDVTEVALSQVTDEFIAHIRAAGAAWDLGQATEFLVVAATLLDLKAARRLRHRAPAIPSATELRIDRQPGQRACR